jgi:hypothetical protein
MKVVTRLLQAFFMVCILIHVYGLISPITDESVTSHSIHIISYTLCLLGLGLLICTKFILLQHRSSLPILLPFFISCKTMDGRPQHKLHLLISKYSIACRMAAFSEKHNSKFRIRCIKFSTLFGSPSVSLHLHKKLLRQKFMEPIFTERNRIAPSLYKIPATGAKPMEYSVIGLPQGLTLDKNTGIISGITPAKNNYTTPFNCQEQFRY